MAHRSFCLWSLTGALAVLGCSGGGSSGEPVSEFRDDFDTVVDLRPAEGETLLQTLEPALSPQETRALRDAFSWESADDLPETDASGRPALYYALIYLQARDDIELLELTGVHHSFVPLFERERDKWVGQAGFFTLEGDGEGVFTFAIIPGIFFNIIKELALRGEPVFRAVVLREPPSEAGRPDGTLSYDYLESQGFLYGGGLSNESDSETALAAHSDAVGRQESALTSQLIRTAVSPIEDIVDEIRAFFGGVAGVFDGTVRIRVSVRPLNTDPSFDDTWMRRAWGDTDRTNSIPSLNAPMWFRNAIVQSHKGGALFRGRLEGWGVADLTVAKGEQNICVELANPASEITNFLTALVLCNFNDPARPDLNLDIQEGTEILMEVQDARTSMFAQFQDGHDYMKWVVGREPRQARVVVGLPADTIGEINGGRAVALCFGDPTTFAALPAAVIFETIGPGFLLSVGDADIVMPHLGGPSANSRGVPTHEYGHHVMCDLMHATNTAKFYESLLNIMVNAIAPDRGAGDPDPNNQTLYGTEALADFFALQVVGGTNYFTLPGARGGGNMSYCPVAPPECAADNPRTPEREDLCFAACSTPGPGCGQDCAEDNVGSPPGATSDYAISATPSDGALFDRNIARLVTIFHDAFDGMHDPPPEGRLNPSPGAAFTRVGGRFSAPVHAFTDANDEVIALPGDAYVRFYGNLYDQWATISEPNFLNALALTMFDYGYTANEVCDFFAIHTLTGDCMDLLHPSVLSGDDLVPGPVLNFRVTRERAIDSRDVIFSWDANSRFATGYELRLVPASGAPRTVDIAYAEEVSHVESTLVGDMLYAASVTTVNGTNRSEPVEQEFVTYADPVEQVSASPERGRVEVAWIPPLSGRVQSYELWQLEPEERLIELTTETATVVPGLSDAFEYQFAVGAVNQLGEVGPLVPGPRVRPLPSVVVYVAENGNDTAPGAGSIGAPFAHLEPALQRAADTNADTVRMLEGTYSETGPLLIDLAPGAYLRIEGGYRDAGSTWVQDGGPTRVEVDGTEDGFVAPSTVAFNPGGKSGAAMVAIGAGVDVTIANLTLVGTGTGGLLPSSRCTAVLHVTGSNLRLERAAIGMERSASTDACAGGVFAVRGGGSDPRLTVADSDIRGFSPPGAVAIPQGLQLAGAAIEDGTTLIVQDSRVSGLLAPLTFDPGGLSSVGLAAGNMDNIRIQRSSLLASGAPTGLRSFGTGTFNGAELEASANISVDDTVFRTPIGGTRNNAIEVRSTSGGLPIADLVHITAIAGTDWDLTDAPTLPFAGAALKITGTIEVLHIVNSVFSFAGGASDSALVRYTGIDLSERDDLPVEFASEGNIISTPGFDLYPNAEGSLVYCAPRGVNEFGNAFTQDDLQVGIGYTCGGEVPDSSRWNTGSNIALTEAPNPARSDLGEMLPWCTGATADGYLIAALEELPPPPLASSGISLADAPYGTNAPADRGGRTRNPNNREAAGAWLPVPQIDPPPIIPPGPFTP